jgi:thiamine biosynthesis protein ThiS
MEVTINGEPRTVPDALNITGLLDHLGIPAESVAVELNRAIIRRDAWNARPVPPGAHLEIVHFVGGG